MSNAFSYYGTYGWGKTQTITIPEIATSSSPTVPEFTILVILPLFVAIPLIATILLRKNTLSESL
jgi:hypothetical protein